MIITTIYSHNGQWLAGQIDDMITLTWNKCMLEAVPRSPLIQWHHVISVCCYHIQAELYRFLQANSPELVSQKRRERCLVSTAKWRRYWIWYLKHSHSIFSLEDSTDIISHSTEGKKAETHCPVNIFLFSVHIAVKLCMCTHTSIHLWCYSPFWALASHRFFSVFCLWCVCVCVCVYVNSF